MRICLPVLGPSYGGLAKDFLGFFFAGGGGFICYLHKYHAFYSIMCYLSFARLLVVFFLSVIVLFYFASVERTSICTSSLSTIYLGQMLPNLGSELSAQQIVSTLLSLGSEML